MMTMRIWMDCLFKHCIKQITPQKYTHSLLDFSKSLCYNQDNINERSKLK